MSINASPNCFLVRKLCWMMVYMISACSVVVWWARKPAYVGACSYFVYAIVVRRWLMVAIKILAKGGVMAMLL
jgi:hypothetical protein